MRNKKNYELMALTNQLVSQLLYCSSKLIKEDFDKVATEIIGLILKYEKKVKKLQEDKYILGNDV